MERRPKRPTGSDQASRAEDDGARELLALTTNQLKAISRFPDENPNPVLRIAVDGRLLYSNPAAAPILEAVGTQVGGEIGVDWMAAIRGAVVGGTDLDVLAGHRTFALRPVMIADLEFLNVYGTDITAQRAIVKFPDQNPNPVFRLHWDGRLVYANPASRELIEGLGILIGGAFSGDLFDRLIAAVRAGGGESIEIASGDRDYKLLPMDVPEFGFINVYGTDVTADNEMRRLHFENQRLLLNILPEAIADRLRAGEKLIADRFDDVTLLFADIVGFTALSSSMSPHELVGVLNQVFTVFDELVDRHGLEKVKTIGDAYMVIGGLLDQSSDHTQRVADLALDLADRMETIEAAKRLGVRFRIGIHCGPVIAGVIGTKKFIYDVWGDTVNLASRMESLGIPSRIQISGAVEERLRGDYQLEARGLIEVKGKGQLPTWFLMAGPRSQRTPQPKARTRHRRVLASRSVPSIDANEIRP